MAAPVVSIVIPVYNVESYLSETLESACAQTLRGIEIVCVNDGSDDRSPDILRQWADRDPRVKVVDKDNGGLSSARNAGIAHSCGDIVMFLDADDRLVADACEKVVAHFAKSRADIVTFGATCFPVGMASQHLVECLSPRDAVYHPFSERLLFEEHSRPYVWRSAFKRNFIEVNGLSFPEDISFGEDQVFYFEAYPNASTIVLASDKLYEYRIDRGGSMMDEAVVDRSKLVVKHIEVAERILDVWQRNAWFEKHGWQTLGWLVEFVSLDLAGVPDGPRAPLVERFGRSLHEVIPDESILEKMPFGKATRKVIRWLMGTPDASAPGKALLIRFYVERRGFGQCVRRAVQALGERNAR